MAESIRVLVRSKGGGRPLLLYYVDPQSGREVSKSADTTDKRQAERAASRWEAELLEHRGADGTSWDWFVERFENEHLSALPAKTGEGYSTALNHFRRLIKLERLSAVTTSTISTFQSKLVQEGRPITTVASYLTHLRAAFNWASRVGMIRKAPDVRIPRVGKRKLMRSRPITRGEFQQMHDEADGEPEIQRFLELLWLSGLRLQEACRLSWDRPPLVIDLEAVPYPALLFYLEGHKAGDDDMTPLTPDFHQWLLKTPKAKRHGLVAPVLNSSGKARPAKKIGIRVSEIGEACKIAVNDLGKFASAHDFRRAFGTRWAEKVRPVTLQRLMRHKSIETTLRYYVGLTVADAGAELWGNRRSGAKNPKA